MINPMNDGMIRYNDRIEVRDKAGRITFYLPIEDSPPSQRYNRWEAERTSHEVTARRDLTASLEGNPAYSTCVPGDDPAGRRVVQPQPQTGRLPVPTDRTIAWRSPDEIKACRWPDFQGLDDLLANRIVGPPCSPSEFHGRLVAAGQPEHRRQTLAVEAQEANWFIPEGTVVSWPSEAMLAAELDKLTCPSLTPRPVHTGSHEPSMSPGGSQPSYHTGLGQTYGVRPEGLVINAREERAALLKEIAANCAEIRRLLAPTKRGLVLQGSVEDWD